MDPGSTGLKWSFSHSINLNNKRQFKIQFYPNIKITFFQATFV